MGDELGVVTCRMGDRRGTASRVYCFRNLWIAEERSWIDMGDCEVVAMAIGWLFLRVIALQGVDREAFLALAFEFGLDTPGTGLLFGRTTYIL